MSPGHPHIPPLRREDRDAVGLSSKRVASSGPPVVRAFAATKEGRDERAQQAQERLAQNRERAPPHQRGRGGRGGQHRGSFRGGRPAWNAFGPMAANGRMSGGAAPWEIRNSVEIHSDFPHGQQAADSWPSGFSTNEMASGAVAPQQGEAGPSTWNLPSTWSSQRAYSPSQPTDTSTHYPSLRYTGGSHGFTQIPSPGPVHHPFPPFPPPRPLPAAEISPQAATTQLSPPNAITKPPAPVQPAAKIVFHPTKRPIASTKPIPQSASNKGEINRVEEKDELKEENHAGDHAGVHESGSSGEDRKPTAQELEYTPVDPATQITGTLAFKKTDLPASCFAQPGKDRIIARQQFKQIHYSQLLQQGKIATHCMWRDDGFAVDWERSKHSFVPEVPDPNLAPPAATLHINNEGASGSDVPRQAPPTARVVEPVIPIPVTSAPRDPSGALPAATVNPLQGRAQSKVTLTNSLASAPHLSTTEAGPSVPANPADGSSIPLEADYTPFHHAIVERDETGLARKWINKYRIPEQFLAGPKDLSNLPAFNAWKSQVILKAAELDEQGDPTMRVSEFPGKPVSRKRVKGEYHLKLFRLSSGEKYKLPPWVIRSAHGEGHDHSASTGGSVPLVGDDDEMSACNNGDVEGRSISGKRRAEDLSREAGPASKKAKAAGDPQSLKDDNVDDLSKKDKVKARGKKKDKQVKPPERPQEDVKSGRGGKTPSDVVSAGKRIALSLSTPSSSTKKSTSLIIPVTTPAGPTRSAPSVPSSSSAPTLLANVSKSPALNMTSSGSALTIAAAAPTPTSVASIEPSTHQFQKPSAEPTGQGESLAELEARLFKHLDTIDLWTELIKDYPSRTGLRAQIERVQGDIFGLQAEISRRKQEQ